MVDLNNAGATSDSLPTKVSRDMRVRTDGWHRNLSQPLWRIAQDGPYAFTLLAVTAEYKANT